MIQSRYGWTDEVVRNLLFSRFEQLIELLFKAKREKTREKFILAAFVGWQMNTRGDKTTFGTYLSRLGLSDEPPQRAKSRSVKDDDAKLARMGIRAKKTKKQ